MEARPPVSTNRTAERSVAVAPRVVTIGFYLGCSLVLLALVTQLQKSVLPEGIATQIGHNSETLALALAVVATIQYARPRWLTDRRGEHTNWGFVLAIAAVWLALALGVYYLEFAASIGTLNEPLAGATLLTVYLGFRRAWPMAWVVPAAVVLLVVVGHELPLVIAQAETVTSFAAVAIAVDYAQRSILQPRERDSWAWGYWLFLAVCPALMLFLSRQDIGGAMGAAVSYTARGAEGFWGALLVCLFFAVLRRTENSSHPRA